MFTTRTTILVECNGCDTQPGGPNFTRSFSDTDAARRQLEQDGWLLTGDRALCPECVGGKVSSLADTCAFDDIVRGLGPLSDGTGAGS